MPDMSPVYRLRDGALVRVRGVRPSDEGSLRAAFHELSPHSRQQRFLRPVSHLSDPLWRYLCNVDGRNHVALVAFDADESRVVGVARFIRQSTNPSVAEVAFTVADAWQRRGLGSLLFDLLADAASRAGVVELVAHALPNNIAIRRLLAHHEPCHVRSAGVEVTLTLRLCGPGHARKHCAGQA